MEEDTPRSIALDLEYHIRHIKRYAKFAAASGYIAVGVHGSLQRATVELDIARISLLDGLDRIEP